MKKFRFPLETVLSYKQQILDALQGEHAVLLGQVRQQETHIEHLWQDYKDFDAEYQQQCSQGISVIDALACQEGLRARERDIRQATKRLQELRKQEEAKREEVITYKQDTSSLEKLKEKQWGEYQAAVAKDEEQMVEEFVATTRSMSRAEEPVLL